MFEKIRLRDFNYKDILNIRITSKKNYKIVSNLFEKIKSLIKCYNYHVFKEGCICCSKIIVNDLFNQSFNPLDYYTSVYGIMNYCSNAECYFKILKSKVCICLCVHSYKKDKARIYCNPVLINTSPNKLIKIKRSDGSITENVKIKNLNIIWYCNQILVCWYEKSKHNIYKEILQKRVLIEDVLELNPHIKLNNNLLLNPFDKYFR